MEIIDSLIDCMDKIDPIPLTGLLAKGVGTRRCFFLSKRPSKRRNPLVLVMGGREHCKGEYSVSRQAFPYFCLEFVAGGEGQAILNGKVHRLSRGIMFSYAPNTNHKITTDPQFLLTKYFLSFEGINAADYLDRAGLPPGQSYDMGQHYAWIRIFEEIVQAGQRVDALGDRLCALLFEVLFLKLEQVAWQRQHPHDKTYSTYSEIRKYIDENFKRLMSLKEIASELDTTPAQICRLFKKYSESVSPHQYLIRRKMNLAADLLVTSGKPIHVIAHTVGFKDALHFSRVFRVEHGRSPTDFIDKRHSHS